jgi:pilus assembly protein CpaE
VARVGARRREKQQDGFQGQVLTFLGAKGGCGVTTVATHLGALLAKSFSRKTLLIDLHPTFGEAALYLGLTEQKYDFYELADSTHRLDAELLQSFLLHHSGGLDVLAAPSGSDAARHVASESLNQTIDFLRTRYEFIVVDCPPGLTEHNIDLMRRSDQVYLVTVAEVSALRNMVLYLDYLNRLEFSHDRVHVVLNRHVKRGAITDAEIEKALRRSIDWKVPNQYNQVIRTLNSGDPVAQLSSSEVARNVMTWAEKLGRKPEEGAKPKNNKGILGLWTR